MSDRVSAQRAPQGFSSSFKAYLVLQLSKCKIPVMRKGAGEQVDQQIQLCLVRTYNLSPYQLAQQGVEQMIRGLRRICRECQQLARQQQRGTFFKPIHRSASTDQGMARRP